MYTLSLKKYRSLDLAKSDKEFLEFYVNDQPLSELLDRFYEMKGTILDSWIGVLGSFENHKAEIIKVKQLLGKTVSDKEIRQVYPAEWSEKEFEWYLAKMRQELSDPEVIIYCCAQCGDYDCGGIWVKIEKTDDAFVWVFANEEKQLNFSFDKYQYFDVLGNYLQKLIARST